jgi:hypothetical protein
MVNGKSKIRTLREFIDQAKVKPPSIGGIGAVNVEYIVPKLLSERAGFKFDYVAFNNQGELTTALLSGALDAAMSNPGEVLGLLQSGDLRALVYTGKKTPMLGNLPTLAQEGYDLGISMPRGLVLPPGVEGNTGLVDRNGQEDRRDAGMEGIHRKAAAHRECPLWRGLPYFPARTHGTFSETEEVGCHQVVAEPGCGQ